MFELKQEVLKEQAYLTALRREFHRYPELGFQEFRTADRIEEELDRIAIPHARVGDTGVLGILKGGEGAGGIIALRADIDALPIQETHETDYCSTVPGVMHACGHDAHTACLLGADALYIASQLVVGLQALVTRRTSPIDPVVIGVGRFSSGTTYNAVAESAVLEGTTRTVSQEQRCRLRDPVNQAAKNIAAIYGGTAGLVWTDFTPPLINDPQVCKEAAKVVNRLGGTVVTDRALSLSGDNFAEFQLYVPGAYAYLGTGNPELPHTLISNHNGGFDIDESALPLGAALYAGFAMEKLSYR